MVFARFLHLLSLGLWLGGITFFSFFVAPAVFKSFPREQAGAVIGVIFQKYYIFHYLCAALALVTGFVIGAGASWQHTLRLGILIVMAGLSLYLGLFVGRNAASVKVQMAAVSDEAALAPLKAEFDALHWRSVQLNSILLLLGLVALFLAAMTWAPAKPVSPLAAHVSVESPGPG